jgi:hypothetical protein
LSENDFYVGYLPKSPESQGRFTRSIVIALGLSAIAIVLSLSLAQQKLPAANFEFGTIRHFEGSIEDAPYPTLTVGKAGEAASRYLLVAPGKHGADGLVRDYAGKNVSLDAKLIYREGQRMLEVMPGSIRAISTGPPSAASDVELGKISLIGEIVDSKCYTGVMNPGSGKVHRDCAARCISGGIPPIFVAKDKNGSADLYVLASADGKPLSKEILQRVAQPVTVEGRVVRRGSTLMVYADPLKIVPVPESTIRGWSCPRRRPS